MEDEDGAGAKPGEVGWAACLEYFGRFETFVVVFSVCELFG